MKIEIVVDETKFKDVLEEELKAFSKEELHDIIRNCIIDTLHNTEVLKNLFVVKKTNYYGTVESNPSDVVKEAAKRIDLSPAYKEIQELMINELKNNYKELLRDVLLGLIIDGITSDNMFRDRMKDAIRDISFGVVHKVINN